MRLSPLFIAAWSCALLLLCPAAFGQQQGRQDTTGRQGNPDSLYAALTSADSTRADTVRMNTPALVGTFDRTLDSSQFVTRDQLHWIDQRYLGDVLRQFGGIVVQTQNGIGEYPHVRIKGSDWRSIGVMMNGRNMNDPVTGIYNLYQFSSEYADRIEVVTSPRAFLYGINSTGGAINLLTKNYNSNRPFTKFNYTQGDYGYEYSDGTFSQNISRKINITAGFQHQGWDGRFTNSYDKAWNVRGKLRYNPIPDLNIILSEYFTTSETGLNGGVDVTRTRALYDPYVATIMNPDAYEKILRHDVDLAFIGTFLGDTVNVSALDVYYSHNQREYRDEENRGTPNGIFLQSDHISSWMGLHFTQNLDAAFQRLRVGGSLELRQVEGSPNIGHRKNLLAAAWGSEEFLLGDLATVAGYGRIEDFRGQSYLGAGTDATLHLGSAIALYGGLSFSNRLPSYTELFWNDSTVARPAPIRAEKHRQIEAGVRLSLPGGTQLSTSYFHRTVLDPILILPHTVSSGFPGLAFVNGNRLAVNGIGLSAAVKFWVIRLEGSGTWQIERIDEVKQTPVPALSGEGGIYYEGHVVGQLELKAGVRGRYQSSEWGEMFNGILPAFVPNTIRKIGRGSSADFFLIAHIGDAYINLMWENLTDVTYFTMPFHPVTDRVLRFGVSWEFWN